MESNLQKIKALISSSNLDIQEQAGLIEFFNKIDDAKLPDIAALFSEDPSWIRKINDNYKNKETAVSSGDSDLWQKIISDEENQIEEI